jgi:hypothetical protein
MSYVSAISVSAVSAVCAGIYTIRSVKSGKAPGELAYWGAGILCVGCGAFIYIFLGYSILGGSFSDYSQPTLFGSPAERRGLFIYAVIAAGLSMLVSAGLATIVPSRRA